MKVGIYTNLDERCGNAEYARHLRQYLEPYYGPLSFSDKFEHLIDCNVVLVNWHSAVAPFFLHDAGRLQSYGCKIILIHQNSLNYEIIREGDQVLSACSAIIAHEPMGKDVIFIPHGIPIVDNLSPLYERKIGTAGFASPWKRLDVVAEVAKNKNVRCLVIAPNHGLVNPSYVDGVRAHIPDLIELYTHWMQIEEVVQRLSACLCTIFWFNNHHESDELGQTGSARMGIAARRPVIISRHRKFRTLLDYDDELYVCDTEQEVNDVVQSLLEHPEDAKIPNRVLQDMGWPTVAKKYKEVIDSL